MIAEEVLTKTICCRLNIIYQADHINMIGLMNRVIRKTIKTKRFMGMVGKLDLSSLPIRERGGEENVLAT
jgi:hypothetical protein